MITLKNAFKNRNKIMKEISSGHISTADEGESDTHYLPPGEERVLGMDMSKPEPWYERGGYQQLDFPTADAMVDDLTERVVKKKIREIIKQELKK